MDNLKAKLGPAKDKAVDLAHKNKDKAADLAHRNKEKAVGLAQKHEGKIGDGLDKMARAVDSKTKGKYHDRIATGTDKAKGAVGKVAHKDDGGPSTPPGSPAAGPTAGPPGTPPAAT
ncbi:antitoxin [Streptomyces sp. NPDC093225]|uniref:antitoxin n=1 Tax=Streptomyces sp. NPDC093225 TaxID=3366034 RepID=UPI003822E079